MPFIVRNLEPDNPYYSDINTNFRIDDKGLVVQDVNAIANQIYNILSTNIGERIFEPEFGSNIQNYIFDPTTEETAWLIENEIFRALNKWMPRIQIIRDKTRVYPVPNERYFNGEITYKIRGLNIVDTLSINLAP